MGKKYRLIKFSLGYNVERAVNELLKYKKEGELVCGEFNGITLYSDTVTMDSAYKKITGKTKSEFDQVIVEWKEVSERMKEEHKDKIPELSRFWMEKGREVLTEDKWDHWNEVVPIRLNDLYQGMELGNCLDVVSVLNNNGTLRQAKEVIESQDHSGTSFNLVCSMVGEFAERGKDFIEYVSVS